MSSYPPPSSDVEVHAVELRRPLRIYLEPHGRSAPASTSTTVVRLTAAATLCLLRLSFCCPKACGRSPPRRRLDLHRCLPVAGVGWASTAAGSSRSGMRTLYPPDEGHERYVVQSAGAAVAWLVDTHKMSLMSQLVVNWGLMTVSYPLLVLLVFLAVKDEDSSVSSVEDGKDTKLSAPTSLH